MESALPGHIRITNLGSSASFSSKLQIFSVELGDTGEYTCNVSNAVGFDHKIKRLEVRG